MYENPSPHTLGKRSPVNAQIRRLASWDGQIFVINGQNDLPIYNDITYIGVNIPQIGVLSWYADYTWYAINSPTGDLYVTDTIPAPGADYASKIRYKRTGYFSGPGQYFEFWQDSTFLLNPGDFSTGAGGWDLEFEIFTITTGANVIQGVSQGPGYYNRFYYSDNDATYFNPDLYSDIRLDIYGFDAFGSGLDTTTETMFCEKWPTATNYV